MMYVCKGKNILCADYFKNLVVNKVITFVNKILLRKCTQSNTNIM
jgi:hypothetical protein